MKRLSFAILAFVPMVFASCLKDKNVTNQQYGLAGLDERKLIELTLTPNSTENYKSMALDAANRDTVLNLIPVTLAYKDAAGEDIKVVLKPDTALLSAHNAEAHTSHMFAPDSVYTILNPKSSDGGYIVTIPAGSRRGYLQMRINPTKFLGKDYAVAFSIARVENTGYTISTNFSTGIVAIGIKNKYDGVYSLRSKQIDWNTPYGISNQVWDWPYEISMITSGETSVNMFSNAHGDYIHPTVTSAGGASGFGSTNPRFIFDPATDRLVNVVNSFPNPANGRSFEMNPAVTDSRYDPATKTIYAAIIMKQPGRPNLQIFDTLHFEKAR